MKTYQGKIPPKFLLLALIEPAAFFLGPLIICPLILKASSAPATPTAVSETSRSIKVTWNEPSPLNGILHNYQIQYKKSDASFSPSISVDKHIREKVIDGLDPYTSYEFQVKLFMFELWNAKTFDRLLNEKHVADIKISQRPTKI